MNHRRVFYFKCINGAQCSKNSEKITNEGNHGFGIDALNINKALPQGETVVVEFVADRKGE